MVHPCHTSKRMARTGHDSCVRRLLDVPRNVPRQSRGADSSATPRNGTYYSSLGKPDIFDTLWSSRDHITRQRRQYENVPTGESTKQQVSASKRRATGDGPFSHLVLMHAAECAASVRRRPTSLAPYGDCLLYTSPSPRDKRQSRMPSSA